MPLTMPATLRTMDMRLVYDEGEERITMRMGDLGGFVDGIGLGHGGRARAAAGAEGPMGSRWEGMDMGAGKKPAKDHGCGRGHGDGPLRRHGNHGMGMSGIGDDRARSMAPLAAGAMRITYDGKFSDWTLAALAALPHKTITVHNAHTKATETYSGVPLIDLLDQTGRGQPTAWQGPGDLPCGRGDRTATRRFIRWPR